jgi:hypothetical protein
MRHPGANVRRAVYQKCTARCFGLYRFSVKHILFHPVDCFYRLWQDCVRIMNLSLPGLSSGGVNFRVNFRMIHSGDLRIVIEMLSAEESCGTHCVRA